MSDRTTRRGLLAAGTAVGLAAIAGCTEGGEGPSENASGDEGSNGNDSGGNESTEEMEEFYDEIDFADPEGSVEFVAPTDGAAVTSPVHVELAVEDFELIPTEGAELAQGEGHLHVLIDRDPYEPEQVIPRDDDTIHLDEGGTDTQLRLDPGEHRLVAQATDSFDTAYDMTDEVTVEVTGGEGAGNETGGEGAGNETGGEGAGNETDREDEGTETGGGDSEINGTGGANGNTTDG